MHDQLIAFEGLIKQLMSPDNALRSAAEASFNESKKFPDQLIGFLLQLTRTSADPSVKEQSLILLRKLIIKSKDSLWDKITAENQAVVKEELLKALSTEEQRSIRSKLCDTIAELGAILFPEGKWAELLPFMFNCTKSAREIDRESALNIFSQLIIDIAELLKQYLPHLKAIFAAGLNDTSLKVRLAALHATVSFVEGLTTPEDRNLFQDLIPAMIEALRAALAANQSDDALKALELLVELVDSEPTFLRPYIPQVVACMLQIASSTELDESLTQYAVEFLVTLAERRPGMVRKIPDFLQNFLPIVLKMMSELEENEDWNKGEEFDNDDHVSEIGDESIDRLAIALGGKTLTPVLFNLLQTLRASQDWKHRHASVMAISLIGEGCQKFLRPHLDGVMTMVLSQFSDPHPRVRWAVCNTIGQMSTDFGPAFQQRFHATVIPALITAMNDQANPRVQSHAASAIINFCEHCETELLAPYLDALLGQLVTLLQHGQQIVQEQAITAVAAIADCVQEEFNKYYDTFVPFLKTILARATDKQYRMLRGKAIECISLIGVSVGKQKFAPDAKEVMEMFVATQSKLEDDDPQASFMLQAWARLCKCLGADFVPYLQIVMPPLLETAQVQPDVKVAEHEAADLDEEGWDWIQIAGKNIGIKTSLLEEKATACDMLYCYAEELKEGFFPYVDTVAKIIVPLLKFYYHDGVRKAAVSTVPCLLASVRAYAEKTGTNAHLVNELLNFSLPPLLEATKAEVDLEILAAMLETAAQSIEIAGENVLNANQLQSITETIKEVLEDFIGRRKERLEQTADQDFDGEEEERLDEELEREEEILSLLGDLVGKISKSSKEAFVPYFQQTLLSYFATMLDSNNPAHDRQVALCVFDDLVDFGKSATLPFLPPVVNAMLNYILDIHPGVRQAAVYGIGVCAQIAGPQSPQLINDVCNRLKAIISAPNSREEENAHATENAIAAFAKLIAYQSSCLDLTQALPLWLSYLPVKEDKIESKITYTLLCSFLESSDTSPILLGNGFQNLPQVLRIFATVLSDLELIDPVIQSKVKSLLSRFQSSIPGEILQKSFASLTPQEQTTLQQAASS